MSLVRCSDGVLQHGMGTNDLPASALESSPTEEEVSTSAAAASGPISGTCILSNCIEFKKILYSSFFIARSYVWLLH